MSDARETAPESPSGEPLDTAPEDEPERGTPVDDDDIAGESRSGRPPSGR